MGKVVIVEIWCSRLAVVNKVPRLTSRSSVIYNRKDPLLSMKCVQNDSNESSSFSSVRIELDRVMTI